MEVKALLLPLLLSGCGLLEPQEKPDGCYDLVVSVDTVADTAVVVGTLIRNQGGCDK